MGNLGAGEILFITIFALLVFGPKRLPEIGRAVGKALAEIRKTSNEFKEGFARGMEDLQEPLVLNGPTRPTNRIPDPAAGRDAAPAATPSPPPADAGRPSGQDEAPAG
jgi:sec-independent protein translocase protein TatA